MKLNRLHSITLTSLLALLLFTGCQDETDALPSEGRRTITLDLGIAMTRAEEDDQVVRGEANDLKIWLFDQNGNFLRYIEVEQPKFTGRDLQGNPVESVEEEFDITNVTQLQFRVLLNTDNLTLKDAEGNALTLGENTTINEIDAATFQFSTPLPDADNKVPMYGTGGPIDITTSKDYHAEIPLTRAVGKLELFFTKESEDGYLAIDKVELAQVPDKGYLKAPETYDLTYKGTATLFNSDEGEIIQSSLPESITTGYFSEHESDFQRIDLMQDYLLENPNPEPENNNWNDPETGNTDYIYPYDPENPTDVAAQDTRYMMTIHYRTSESETTSKTQIVYLPRIERNVWNKIFARVKDEEGTLEIKYKVLPWNKVESAIGYAPESASTNKSPFSNETEYNTFVEGNNYILLPEKQYSSNYNTTQKLFDYLYMNPEEGDNEARLCILTRPTYDNEIDDEKHWALKTGSAGVRYYFMLTGPKGATWEAHLNDPEGNFAFSTSENDEDFKNCTDEDFEKTVRMVSHGIAREQPYIIQIIATHLYTGYQSGMLGTSKLNTEPRFENGYEDIKGYNNWGKDDWEPYFGDSYLTDWGNEKWKNEEVVEAEFYITVKYPNGEEHELTINPSYNNNSNIEYNNFPFKEKRRYAGNDTRIWLRHVRAIHAVPNLEYLARDLQSTEGCNEWEIASWWNKNEYWNSNYDWK